MATRRLANLRLDVDDHARLKHHHFTIASQLVSSHEIDLSEQLDISVQHAIRLRAQVAAQIVEPPRNALQLLEQMENGVATTNSQLSLSATHKSLRITPGLLTEITGPAGMGKSQCCMTAALMSAIAGDNVLFIDTEGTFSTQRLKEMSLARYPECDSNLVLAAVHVIHLPLAKELIAYFQNSVEQFIIERNIKLLVLDSIAKVARHDFSGRSSLVSRQEFLGSIAASIKYVAQTFALSCLVTNQVTTRFESRNANESSTPSYQASLGISWTHSVNTRFVVQDGDSPGTRVIVVAKSPQFKHVAYTYSITAGGVVVDENELVSALHADVNNMRIRKRANAGSLNPMTADVQFTISGSLLFDDQEQDDLPDETSGMFD